MLSGLLLPDLDLKRPGGRGHAGRVLYGVEAGEACKGLINDQDAADSLSDAVLVPA